MLQKLTVPPQIKKPPCHFLHCKSLWLFSYFFLLSLFIFSLSLQFHQDFISSLPVLPSRVQWNNPLADLAPASHWGSLSCWRLLWTPHKPSLNPWKSWTNGRQNFFHTLFTVMAITSHQAKWMFFMALYMLIIVLPKFSQDCHLPLLHDKKCEVNNVSWKSL